MADHLHMCVLHIVYWVDPTQLDLAGFLVGYLVAYLTSWARWTSLEHSRTSPSHFTDFRAPHLCANGVEQTENRSSLELLSVINFNTKLFYTKLFIV